jgi:uridine kinase
MIKLISIAGRSGVGKTTISTLLSEILTDEKSVIIYGDDSHRWERGDPNWDKYTHFNPEANLLEKDYVQLLKLKLNKSIERKHYDHDTGKFTEPNHIEPKQIIIYDGLHGFYDNRLKSISDLKIYVKASEPLRQYWKINRDIKERGHTMESVVDHCVKRDNDFEKYIAPQEKDADIVIFFELQDFIETDFPVGNDIEFCLQVLVKGAKPIYNCNLDNFKKIISNVILNKVGEIK